MNTSQLLKHYRLKKKMSRNELAKKLKLSVRRITEIEQGEARLPMKRAKRVSNLLDIPKFKMRNGYINDMILKFNSATSYTLDFVDNGEYSHENI